MINIQPFKDIVLNYEAVFFDAFGVLKTYEGVIDGIQSTFDYLKEKKIDFYIVTNDASRGPAELAEGYQQKGIADITEQKIISSGMLAREYLKIKINSGRVVYLGTPKSASYMSDLHVEAVSIGDVDLSEVADITALVLLDDEGFDWREDLNKTLNLVRRTNIPVIVANTDYAYPVGRHNVSVAIGGIADLLEDISGKTFIRFGKPDSQMFNFAYEHLGNFTEVSRDKILMVGDTLQTDILGGNKFGVDTALVLSGNTLEDNAEHLIRTTGIIPDYICESILL